MSDFEKKLTLPAIVAERPGRSRIHITASITGVVTEIFAVEGQAVEENSPLFELRITNEDVVTAQRDFLRTSESLNVVNRELARLTALPEGVIPGKRILDQEYEKQKLEASLLAEQQALVVHGLSEEQVKNILDTRQLLRTITISAPDHTHEDDGCEGEHLFHVQSLPVSQGEQVATGQELAVLADHCELFVEGRAFEDDAARLREAAREGWNVEGVLLVGDKQKEVVNGLKLLYLADHIDPESRAFRFYLRLPMKLSSTNNRFPVGVLSSGTLNLANAWNFAFLWRLGKSNSSCPLKQSSMKEPKPMSIGKTATTLIVCLCTSNIVIVTPSWLPTTGPCFPVTLLQDKVPIKCTWP